MSSDLFDDVFTLEDRFYTQGYNQGVQDGARAGRIEGRSLGMEKGFEKFLESGRIASKSLVWANRLPQTPQPGSASEEGAKSSETCTLPPLPKNPRLEKNIKLAYALVEPDTLSTENSDEAVQDFDDRVKRAQGKVKIIEKMLN
ncbi:hypothetical protein TGAM01_v202707 [Trichoderma gamsii]|uniref:Essential protein Yae1 N-terminal domain-containing protein n=1 Tax=Trichoderma gamsii TaxID=398673 RepID=A0A0W7VYG8_9HYPO|nr:hypothetical protein TGAM01_v202707 [Trichoderma gamsii]PNP43303.1 hypothetical protein TGAMA5MH_04760 [Trichoderma gamsii]PON28213.1 hypothetical protein TGAM01_v202707 [Trichoderma gamsii]